MFINDLKITFCLKK